MKHRHVSGLVVIVALIAIPAAQVGCGDDDDGGSTEATTAATATEATTTEGAGGDVGEELFVSGCGSCHTLAAAGTTGTDGPNLDDLAPHPKDEVLEVIAEGPETMPADIYTGEEAEQVADYVSSAAGSSP